MTENLHEAIQRVLREGVERMDAWAKPPPGDKSWIEMEGDAEPIEVKKLSCVQPVSLDMMLAAGLIGEEEARAQGWTPPPPVSRWRRLRWRWWDWRERVGRKVGGWIAGQDLSERDD